MIMPNSKQAVQAKQGRLTLGFLSFHEDGDYHNHMMSGILEAARKHDVNIILFNGFGHSMGNEGFTQEMKDLLAIIREQNLDGLMFIGWLHNFVSGFQEEISRLSMPLFSIGAGHKDIPYVYTDGGIYLRELLHHLIQVHGCKKIAFVSPRTNTASLIDNRIQIYMDVMGEYGIYDPRLFVNALVMNPAGMNFPLRAQKALAVLLDERKISFDAIVSPYNDEAVAILKELGDRGIRVPEDIKIVGYEDDDSGKYATVPITTVYFPFWELGFHGCERFIKILTQKNYNHASFSSFIAGRIILRNSCGCISSSVTLAANNQAVFEGAGPLSTEPNQNEIWKQMSEIFPAPSFDMAELLNAFFMDFRMKTGDRFIEILETQLITYYQSRNDASGIQDFISQLRKLMLPYLAGQIHELVRMEDLLHQARIAIEEKAVNLLGHQTAQIDHLHQMLHKISQKLITTFQIQKLMNVLELSLVRLNIHSCYLFLFNRAEDAAADTTLAFEYLDGWRVSLNANQPPFHLKNLLQNLPQTRRYSLLTYFLAVNEENIGLVLFEPGPPLERVYFTLSVLLSTALKGAILVEKLENTNRELISAQQELVAKAHKTGMADIATGTLHNIGNVLNSINTSIYMMKDIIRDSPMTDFQRANELLKNHMKDLKDFITNDPRGKKLLQFYLKLEAPFDDMQNLIFNHLNRLMDRINLVNEIIVAQQNYAGARPISEELDLVDVIDDALKIQLASLEKYSIKIIKDYRTLPKAVVQRTKLLYILMNLFNNARDAMKNTEEAKRTLILSLDEDEQSVYLQVSDSGQGIPPGIVKNIFVFGFTTKQEGHGFGLHSCANYMTEMGGRIWAESPGEGKGATFILQFWKKNKESPDLKEKT
jgi:DNA-binding LacI/PurR family transcriptional regulator/signal transduction histidine kinase